MASIADGTECDPAGLRTGERLDTSRSQSTAVSSISRGTTLSWLSSIISV
jgi:hypothetical protein